MTTDRPASELRRYVLGAATDTDAATIERDYFENVEALERVREAEVDLIDDYVSGQLSGAEHEAFERRYLTTAARRRRVAVARVLGKAAAARSAGRKHNRRVRWTAAALAATVAVLVGGGVWMLRTRSSEPATVDNRPLAVPSAVLPDVRAVAPLRNDGPAPVVVTIAISPILVRGASTAQVTIAAGTDFVRLLLLDQAADRRARPRSAVVRTVAGREIWRGPAVDAQPQELAQIEIPAATLRPDDYIIELVGAGTDGRRLELHRYFLSVRAP
jgi:hypothetical protein